MSNILVITEGKNPDISFIKKIFEVQGSKINVLAFGTNIYTLYKLLKENDYLDADILDILRHSDKFTNEEKSILNQNYLYTYLVFDFDVHANDITNHYEILFYMCERFSDETDEGKLYINYPMAESFKDQKIIGESEYLNSFINYEEIKNYKKIVGERGNQKRIDRYDRIDINKIATQNLEKCFRLLNIKDYSYKNYLDKCNQVNILNAIFKSYKSKEHKIWILNTSSLIGIDFIGKELYEECVNQILSSSKEHPK